MSEEQLSALLAKVMNNAALKEKLQAACDRDAFVAVAQEAGFDVNEEDWLRYQDQGVLEIGDDALAAAAGGQMDGEDCRTWGPAETLNVSAAV